MQTIILLGAPGAGKGTLAERVRDVAHYTHVSTGDMLRAAVKAGTPTGLEAKRYMEAGELVPDAVIMRLVEERLAKDGDGKYMFDGFPRTDAQAVMLDEVLARAGAKVDKVFLLDVPQDVIVGRISGRRVCRKCGAVYHVANIPPRVEGVCDQCGGELYQRADDCEATVLNRLEVYNRQTAGLIDFYNKKGVLVRIDASASPKATADAMLELLG